MKNLFTKFNIRSLLFISILLFSSSIFAQKGGEMDIENSVVKTINDANLQWGPCPSFMPDGCNIAVLHGDPSKNNVDILFKVKGGSEIPNHWHSSPERMILLSGKLSVTYENETTQVMKTGSYAYGPSSKKHTAKCISKEPCVIFIAFEEPLDAFAVEVK